MLAMALAGVMLLTILTGCSGGKTGDRLVEEYMAAYFHGFDAYKDIPITHDVPEIKTVADMFETSWLKDDGSWTFSSKTPNNPKYKALRDVFNKYASGYTVNLYAFEVDSKQRELNQTMRHPQTKRPPSKKALVERSEIVFNFARSLGSECRALRGKAGAAKG